MHWYAEANTACGAQYSDIEARLGGILALSLEEMHSIFHDGVGLTVAPGHCYFGRSLIVHAYLNLKRFENGLSPSERAAVIDEFGEVAQHIARVRQNIEHPPLP